MHPYICEICCARYEESGDCTKCSEEVLLDLRDDDVIEFLENSDEIRLRTKTKRFGVGLAIILSPGFFIGWLFLGFIVIVILNWLLIGAGTKILIGIFPPLRKCPPKSELNFLENHSDLGLN